MRIVQWSAAACALLAILAAACGGRTGLRIDDSDGGTDVDAGVLCDREIRVSFLPTHRAQLAVWIASESDRRAFETIALTEATAMYGIGNRPGALQMNSGYRWPYGRRENVLPAWAAARLQSGALPFPRVVFRARPSEGHASGAAAEPDPFRDTPDEHFCLSFLAERSARDGLDAVSCVSQFNGDKGRYLTELDTARGYAEPEETAPGAGGWRQLSIASAYPPRRDLVVTADDHPDVHRYAEDALRAMPELDAVTLATPPGESMLTRVWTVPDDWPAGPVTVSVEVNTEGDYNSAYDPSRYPTPSMPVGAWDGWSQAYGYPYRGQPSVVFDVAVEIPPRDRLVAPSRHRVREPSRMGSLDGSLGVMSVDGTLTDDPAMQPGSGVDRLRVMDDARVLVEIHQVRCRAP